MLRCSVELSKTEQPIKNAATVEKYLTHIILLTNFEVLRTTGSRVDGNET